MAFHHRHFPTLTAWAARLRDWYRRRDLFEKTLFHVVLTVGFFYAGYLIFFAPPPGFPTGSYIKVESGASLGAIANSFEERGIIRSAFTFKVAVKLLGDEQHLPAGEYFFPKGQNLVQVAVRLVSGDTQITPVRVTITEGSTAIEIANKLLLEVPGFNKREFLASATEGHLFPDTYFFSPGQSTEAILSVFNNTFRVRLLKVQKDIEAFGEPLQDVLTMASILEKEASKTKDRQLIAGVLWHRIDVGMPLQVDATFPYYLGKNTFQVTLDDLRADHPYNTYVNKGLPPGPIGNPGLDSILAAVTPVKTNYLYFLSDKQGNFHFATTYAQHLVNKAKYLGT